MSTMLCARAMKAEGGQITSKGDGLLRSNLPLGDTILRGASYFVTGPCGLLVNTHGHPNHQCISNQSMLAFAQSYSQSQARLMFVTTLGMDNFDCTKMNAHFKKFTACLREGLIHEWKQALLAPPLSIMSLNNSRLCSTHKPSSAFLYTAALYQRYSAHSS